MQERLGRERNDRCVLESQRHQLADSWCVYENSRMQNDQRREGETARQRQRNSWTKPCA